MQPSLFPTYLPVSSAGSHQAKAIALLNECLAHAGHPERHSWQSKISLLPEGGQGLAWKPLGWILDLGNPASAALAVNARCSVLWISARQPQTVLGALEDNFCGVHPDQAGSSLVLAWSGYKESFRWLGRDFEAFAAAVLAARKLGVPHGSVSQWLASKTPVAA